MLSLATVLNKICHITAEATKKMEEIIATSCFKQIL